MAVNILAMAMAADNNITLANGRIIGYAEYGDSSGYPLFYFHGGQESRLSSKFMDNFAKSNILQDIKGSISTDIQQLKLRIELAKGDIHSADIILNYIDKNIPYNDSLNKHCWVITTTKNKIFTPQISAYKVLESKGIDINSQ